MLLTFSITVDAAEANATEGRAATKFSSTSDASALLSTPGLAITVVSVSVQTSAGESAASPSPPAVDCSEEEAGSGVVAGR